MQASSPLYSVEENTGVQALTVSTRGAQRGTTGTLQLSTVCARVRVHVRMRCMVSASP